MPDSSQNADARLDAELRDVSLPEGLTERLREICAPDDADADPLPQSDTYEIDRLLRDVAIPDELVDGLLQIPLEDGRSRRRMDTKLRGVPVPLGIRARLRRIAMESSRRMRFRAMLAAGSVLLAVGVSYFAALLLVLLTLDGRRGDAPEAISIRTEVIEREEWPVKTGTFSVERMGHPSRPAPMRLELAELSVRVFPGGSRPLLPDPFAQFDRFQREIGPSLNRSVWEGLFDDGRSPDGGISSGGNVLGSAPGPDHVQEIHLLPTPKRSWLPRPTYKGFDLGFLLRHDEWPRVPLESVRANPKTTDPRLARVQVPLHNGTDSFELARAYLSGRQPGGRKPELPPPRQIRKEDFLAAMNYDFLPPEEAALGLRTVAGPSPFAGQPGMFLLQIGVQARDWRPVERPAAHVVVVVDASHSMQYGGRLALVRRALNSLVEQLGPHDRLSMVAYNSQADMVIEDAGRDHADDLRAAIASLEAGGSSNVLDGLRKAYSLAGGPPPSVAPAVARSLRTRVVLLSDGAAELPPELARRAEKALAAAAGKGVTLTIVDLKQTASPTDPPLLSFARAGGGAVVRADAAVEIHGALMEALTGRSQEVAGDVQVTVRFNPQLVESYRLLGHEAPAVSLDEKQPESLRATFRYGQVATGLFEIKPRPTPPGGEPSLGLLRDTVATTTLRWRTTQGDPRRVVQRVSLVQFARSFRESPLPLQLATLAAQTAEVLAGSQFAKGESLEQVLERAREVNFQLKRDASYLQLMSLVRAAVQRGK